MYRTMIYMLMCVCENVAEIVGYNTVLTFEGICDNSVPLMANYPMIKHANKFISALTVDLNRLNSKYQYINTLLIESKEMPRGSDKRTRIIDTLRQTYCDIEPRSELIYVLSIMFNDENDRTFDHINERRTDLSWNNLNILISGLETFYDIIYHVYHDSSFSNWKDKASNTFSGSFCDMLGYINNMIRKGGKLSEMFIASNIYTRFRSEYDDCYKNGMALFKGRSIEMIRALVGLLLSDDTPDSEFYTLFGFKEVASNDEQYGNDGNECIDAKSGDVDDGETEMDTTPDDANAPVDEHDIHENIVVSEEYNNDRIGSGEYMAYSTTHNSLSNNSAWDLLDKYKFDVLIVTVVVAAVCMSTYFFVCMRNKKKIKQKDSLDV